MEGLLLLEKKRHLAEQEVAGGFDPSTRMTQQAQAKMARLGWGAATTPQAEAEMTLTAR
jgi:hypothetical protein